MKRLDLRSRLLIAIGVLAAVQIAVAFFIVIEIQDELVDQIDDRLDAAEINDGVEDAGTPDADATETDTDNTQAVGRRNDGGASGGKKSDPLSDVFEGELLADGTLVTFFASNTFRELAPPAVEAEALGRARSEPITVESTAGDVDYRLRGVSTESGTYLITAIPLNGVERTMDGVITLVAISTAALSLILGLVTWWVLRLGIAPIKRMTDSAEAIAAGDLSERIADTDTATEAGKLGRALNTMLGQIELSLDERTRAEQRLRQFVADASHELRTPVSTIRGYAELYTTGGLDDPAELDDAMRRTREEGERMSRLINDLLDLANLDRQPELDRSPVDLVLLAREVCSDARTSYPGRMVRLAAPDAAVSIEGDKDLLRQAFANLVLNALVHTESEIDVSLDVVEGHPILVVADGGDGMTAEVVRRATERFYRADASRNRNSGGSGLGLSIVQSVVDAHDGTLTIVSSPGNGTEISIALGRDVRP